MYVRERDRGIGKLESRLCEYIEWGYVWKWRKQTKADRHAVNAVAGFHPTEGICYIYIKCYTLYYKMNIKL